MDFEVLKDQWSDIEDRDGVRLSWNTFPSSRMVCKWTRTMPDGPLNIASLPLNPGFRKPPVWSSLLAQSTLL